MRCSIHISYYDHLLTFGKSGIGSDRKRTSEVLRIELRRSSRTDVDRKPDGFLGAPNVVDILFMRESGT